MISTVSKAVHCWCKLNTKKMVNKLSVIGGVWLYTLRLSSIVYRPGAIVWVLAHTYFCIFVLIIKIFFIKFEGGEKKKSSNKKNLSLWRQSWSFKTSFIESTLRAI